LHERGAALFYLEGDKVAEAVGKQTQRTDVAVGK